MDTETIYFQSRTGTLHRCVFQGSAALVCNHSGSIRLPRGMRVRMTDAQLAAYSPKCAKCFPVVKVQS